MKKVRSFLEDENRALRVLVGAPVALVAFGAMLSLAAIHAMN